MQEELGWRGYALPRLLNRWSGVQASLLLGTVWATWHLPLYAIGGEDAERAPLAIFMVSVVALAVLYTWLWRETSGSLLIVLVFHSATNAAASLLLTDAGDDHGPLMIATVLTVALSFAAGIALKRGGTRAGRRDL